MLATCTALFNVTECSLVPFYSPSTSIKSQFHYSIFPQDFEEPLYLITKLFRFFLQKWPSEYVAVFRERLVREFEDEHEDYLLVVDTGQIQEQARC